MKKIIATISFCLALTGLNAQVVTDLKPSDTGEMGRFTDWTQKEVSLGDNITANIEYRIALVARKGIGCHYDVEVKNNSDIKLNIRLKSSYYDKLVKGQFGDEIKESLKAGKSFTGRFVAQGCKKEKGSEMDDCGQCNACDFGVSIYVSK